MLGIGLFLSITIYGCMSDQSLEELSKGSNKFTAEVYQALSNVHGNIAIAPISATLLLSLLASGAENDTKSEIVNSLHLIRSDEERNDAFKELTSGLKTKTTNTLKLVAANRVYLGEGIPVKEKFNETAVNDYDTEVVHINFQNTENSISTINGWVEEETDNTIHKIVDSDDLSPNSKLVLISALYLQGKWKEPFTPSNTKAGPFYTSENETKSVDFMHDEIRAEFRHCGYFKAKFLELGLKDNFSVTFVLPDRRNGLGKLEENIEGILEQHDMKNEWVAVTLPKFEIEDRVEYVPPLKKLGVTKAFTQQANFSGAFLQNGISIDRILQKTLFNIGEQGVGDPAIGKRKDENIPLPTETKVAFVAEHPFIFYLRDKSIGTILSVARFQG